MDVLNRIVELREQRGWTEYQLAEYSNLTQSTISSWYRKKRLPTIPSLQKICDAFDITLSQFFLEDDEEQTVSITESQKELMKELTRLSKYQKLYLAEFLKSL